MPRKKIESGKQIKLIAIGDGAVGKTSLIRRWAENKFQKTYLETLGVDITDKVLDMGEETVKVIIWDIAGQERYKQYRSAFYAGTQAVVIVADVTNPATFESLPNWKLELDQFVGKKLPCIFMANKCDLVDARKVLEDEILQVGSVLGIDKKHIFETSALEGQNVNEGFLSLARLTFQS